MVLGSARLGAALRRPGCRTPAGLAVLGVKGNLCDMGVNGQGDERERNRRLEAEVRDAAQKPQEGHWLFTGDGTAVGIELA